MLRPRMIGFAITAIVAISLTLQPPVLSSTAAQEPDPETAPVIVYARRDYDYVGANTDIFSMNVDGSNQINLTNDPGEDIFPAVSPDGTRIAFLSDRISAGRYELYVMDIDGDNQVQLTENGRIDIIPVSWSSDGSVIVFTSFRNETYDLYAVNADTGEETRLTAGDTHDLNPSWSPNSSRLVYVAEDNLYLLDASDRPAILYSGAVTGSPVWSPDGGKIALAAYVPSSVGAREYADIFVIDVETHSLVRLTDNAFDDYAPAWSPDGEYLAFEGETGHNEPLISFDIFVVPVDGSETPRPVTFDPTNDRCPLWSADGNTIFFLSDRRVPFESNDIYAVDADGENLIQLTQTDGNERCPLNFVSRRG